MAMDPYGWEVKEDQDLLTFLRPYEAWRAKWLLDYGMVTVQHRNGAKELVRDPAFPLKRGEKIFIPIGVPPGRTVRDVLFPANALTEMRDDAKARARDFIYQAHVSTYEDTMTDVLKRAHPNHKLVVAGDFAEFLGNLKASDDAPIGTIHVVAHGSTRGNVSAKLRPWRSAADEAITYEGLEEAAGEITTLKVYPPLFLPPRPADPQTGEPMPSALRIHACRIGVHEVFLRKLKEALGPGITEVSAPRFLQGAATIGKRGVASYLRHEFTLLSKKKLTRAALIKAFQAGNLAFAPGPATFHDGTAVPATAWNKWIPFNLKPTGAGWVDTEDMKVLIPGNPKPSSLKVVFQWDKLEFTHRLEMRAASDPADALAKFATHVDAMGPTEQWSDQHPFPMSARLGYGSLQELMDGFEWAVDTEDGMFRFHGTRQEYSVYPPLMRGKDLLCNFYPNDPAEPPVVAFREDDPAFFTRV
jgi:hypothetical protein